MTTKTTAELLALDAEIGRELDRGFEFYPSETAGKEYAEALLRKRASIRAELERRDYVRELNTSMPIDLCRPGGIGHAGLSRLTLPQPRKEPTMTTATLKNKYHRDGTVTYWSVYQQVWARGDRVSDRELAAMSTEERERTIRHLTR